MFDYLSWRGDILFSQLRPNDVDSLIFSTLAYVRFDGIVPEEPGHWITLKHAAGQLLALDDAMERGRVPSDVSLLQAAAETDRFGRVGISFCRDVFIPEEDTQFAAVSFYLEDGSVFLAFRGTDNSLVGWKEDFNMTFEESVPAQRLAQAYTEEFAAISKAPLRLGGHSKGGNLAVYAAAKSTTEIQNRIVEVFNHDGPGFTERMMEDAGYLAIVPKIRTFVPQSSVFGMLLEHEEPYTIIRSREIGLMQHDPYSWLVHGKDFLHVEELTSDSRFLDRTFKNWLAGMTNADRNAFFDTVFDLLALGEAERPLDLISPQNLKTYFKTLKLDENKRRIIASELLKLIESARTAVKEE